MSTRVALWNEWTIFALIGLVVAASIGVRLKPELWSEFALASLVVLSGPVVFFRLYTRGIAGAVAAVIGLFSIVSLAACALMFLKVGR